MCIVCRKESQGQVEDDRTDKEEEKNVITEVEKEIVNPTGYERVYLPETDTSEDNNSDENSDSDDDF